MYGSLRCSLVVLSRVRVFREFQAARNIGAQTREGVPSLPEHDEDPDRPWKLRKWTWRWFDSRRPWPRGLEKATVLVEHKSPVVKTSPPNWREVADEVSWQVPEVLAKCSSLERRQKRRAFRRQQCHAHHLGRMRWGRFVVYWILHLRNVRFYVHPGLVSVKFSDCLFSFRQSVVTSYVYWIRNCHFRVTVKSLTGVVECNDCLLRIVLNYVRSFWLLLMSSSELLYILYNILRI